MTRGMDEQNELAIAGDTLSPILFADLDFPSGHVRVFSGLGTITWGGFEWTGAGTLGMVSGLEENSELARKTVTYTLSGVPNDVISIALGENYQGRPAKAYIGFIGRVPDAATTAYINAGIAAGGAEPSEARKKQIDNLVTRLKSYGVWDKLDALYLLWADDEYFAKVNLKNPGTYNLTATNSPSFTPNQGYISDGSTSYLDTTFNPATAVSPKFVQNDNHMALWSLTNLASSVSLMGNSTHNTTPRASNGALATRNSSGSIDNSAAGLVASSIGHFLTNRSASTGYDRFINATLFDSVTRTSGTLTSRTLWIGGRNHTTPEYSARRVAAAHFGAHLTTSDIQVIYGALRDYMQGEPHEMGLGLVADPELIDSGLLDYASTNEGDTCSISFASESRIAGWSRALVRRYTDSEQQGKYPGDKGLEFVGQAAQKEIVWGRKA